MPFQGVHPAEESSISTDIDPSKDPVAYFKHREAIVAREYCKVADAKLIREKLIKCYRTSGTNYITKCRELAENYLEAIKGTGIQRANAAKFEKATWK